jgi:polyphosphate kinase
MQELLDERKETACIRMEIGRQASRAMISFLTRSFALERNDVYVIEGPLDLQAFIKLTATDGFEALKNPLWLPQPSPRVDLKESLFPQLAVRSVLLHLPYESFDPVSKFVKEASEDPAVLAIKQVLYRTAHNSVIVDAFICAAQAGKHVTVLAEERFPTRNARNRMAAKPSATKNPTQRSSSLRLIKPPGT